MIQIDRHIEILLLDNDCVIVPDLGGFMAHHVCARYCTESQSFLPPLRQLGFNSQLKINDSLLAQSYIEAYDISYPEALRRIEAEVTELKQMLQNNGFCELNDLGTLRLNNEGNIEFEPCEAGILTPELYGLNLVEIPMLNQTSVVAQSGTTNSETDVKQTNSVDIFQESPQPAPQLAVAKDNISDKCESQLPSDKQNDTKTISISVSTLKHITGVAAAIIIMLLCAIPFGKVTQPEITKSYIDTGILFNILPKEMCSPSTDISVRTVRYNKPIAVQAVETDENKEKTEKTENVKNSSVKFETSTEKKNVTMPNHYFSIVLASRVARPNAEDFVQGLNKQGFKESEVISRPNGSVKVIYGHYTTEAEARNSLNNLRDSSEYFAEGWIMEFNN